MCATHFDDASDATAQLVTNVALVLLELAVDEILKRLVVLVHAVAKLYVVQLGRVAAPAAVNLLDGHELALLRLAARAWALARARRDVAALYAELLAHLVAAVLVRALTLPRALVCPAAAHARRGCGRAAAC